jgi:hypothetical protein
MGTKRTWLTILLVLVLFAALLVLAGCGEEEGRQARELVDEAGENAADFAEGFCGALILVPLWIGFAANRRRSR